MNIKMASKSITPSVQIVTTTWAILVGLFCNAQHTDTTHQQRWNIHFQSTVIGQWHPDFKAAYTGDHSLVTSEAPKVSITATVYAGLRLWPGAELYINPEIAGGEGFSKTQGVAGFPNGETYRVGALAPKVYIARGYLRQYINLSKTHTWADDDFNSLHVKRATSYLDIIVGRYSVADFFDMSSHAHDPRTAFFNWGLIGNAAWDYPANTRGYTYGAVVEYVHNKWALRYGLNTVPDSANGADMVFDIRKGSAHVLEAETGWSIKGLAGTLRVLGFLNIAHMGRYSQAIDSIHAHPGDSIIATDALTLTRAFGRTKWGFGINAEQKILKHAGVFAKFSWSDGANETWMFTEIDRSFSAGITTEGHYWHRPNDRLGLAIVANGLSAGHRDFLAAGGYGFIIGDGRLNYAPEFITELYYSLAAWPDHIYITPDYQFILHPAYNADRGPVHALGVRVHVEL
jgi:high affinity Mn2+ porin